MEKPKASQEIPNEEGSPENQEQIREIPKNRSGAHDEWIAVEQQKQRAIEALNKKQKEQEKTMKKLYK